MERENLRISRKLDTCNLEPVLQTKKGNLICSYYAQSKGLCTYFLPHRMIDLTPWDAICMVLGIIVCILP
jgi:hypothetical protein